MWGTGWESQVAKARNDDTSKWKNFGCASAFVVRNLGTWAVSPYKIPAVAHFMHDALPNESFDPHFYGQHLETTYFDTAKYELRKNRLKHAKYITLRVRCYQNNDTDTYALSP